MCYSRLKERVNVKKRITRKSPVVASQKGPSVAELIAKVQQQLSTMEEKLDTLISQSSKKPFEKSYSQQSFRRFNRPDRPDRSDRYERGGPRERTYTRAICADCNKECEIPFKPKGDRPVYCSECFAKQQGESSFSGNRNDRAGERAFPRKRGLDKRQAGKRQKPDKNNNPFYARIKRRG